MTYVLFAHRSFNAVLWIEIIAIFSLRAKPQPIQTNAECFLPTEGRGVLPFSLPKIPASPLSSLSQATPKTEPESILKKKPPSGGDATDKKRQG